MTSQPPLTGLQFKQPRRSIVHAATQAQLEVYAQFARISKMVIEEHQIELEKHGVSNPVVEISEGRPSRLISQSELFFGVYRS